MDQKTIVLNLMYNCFYILRNTETAKQGLNNLQNSVASSCQVLSHVPLMLSALLVTSQGSDAMEVLKVIPILAKVDPSQVSYMKSLCLNETLTVK